MEREYIASEETFNEGEYIKGFNAAAIIADFEPELLNQILPDNNLSDNFFDGLFAGKAFCQNEKSEEKQLDELSSLRNSSREQEREL